MIIQVGGSRGRRTLRILHPQGCRANLLPIVSSFEKLTGVKVELIAGSLDDLSSEIRLYLSTNDGEAPIDLALPATFSIPDLVDSNAIVDLTELVQTYEPKILAEQMLYTVGNRFGGRFYGYQADGDAYLTFYNHGLPGFEDMASQYADLYGIALQTPATWAELDRQLAHFQRPDQGIYGGSLYRSHRYIGWEFWSRLHGNGRYPVDSGFEPNFDGPEGVAALESLIKATDQLEPAAVSNGLFENFQSFAKGDKYANIGWGGTQKYLVKHGVMEGGKLAHGLLPGGLDATGNPFSTPYFNWGWNYVVLRGSTNPELAYLFSLFATTPAISARAVQQFDGYFDPHLLSHYEDQSIRNSYGDSFMEAHQNSLVASIPDFQVRFQERYARVLTEAVYSADRGHLRPSQALSAAAEKWRRITEEAGAERQSRHWRTLRELYPARLREVLV